MLMVDAMMPLVDFWEKGYVPVPNDSVIRDKVIISLFQALARILRTQNADGSWESGGCEVTSYAVISLTKLMSLSSAPKIKLHVGQAIESGQAFLRKNSRASTKPDNVWVGKIASGSNVMYQAYVLAALNAPVHKQQVGPNIESHFDIPLAKVTIQTKYYARQAWFVGVPEWLIQAFLIETQLLLPQIRDVRYAVFPSDSLVDDRYFESIPFAWIVANSLDNRSIGADLIYQMTILSVLGRQLEDYMENLVGETFVGCLFEVEDIIHGIFQKLAVEDIDQRVCDSHSNGTVRSSIATAISDVRSALYRFISHILNHPYVLMASSENQAQLRSELLSFLLSRVSQLSGEQGGRSSTDQTPHFYTFAFLVCLVGRQSSTSGLGLRRDFLDSPEQQYLAANLCRHMSIISYMSTNAEQRRAAPVQPAPTLPKSISLDSLRNQHAPTRSISTASTSSSSYDHSHYPVSPNSSISSAPGSSPNRSLSPKLPNHRPNLSPIGSPQDTLRMTRLLNHERRCLNLCFESLIEAGINQSTTNILKLFVDFNDLSEQIHRDPNIGSTYQPSTAHEIIDQSCILDPPPVPPKRTRGSVAAARAALAVEPLATKQPYQQTSKTQRSAEDDDWTKALALADRTASPIPKVRDWSWNKKPVIPTRRPSRASFEIKRIESIMSEMDGTRLESKPGPRTQRREAIESDAARAQVGHKIDARRRLTSNPTPDAEATQLAKDRLETQRRLSHGNQLRNGRDVHNGIVAEADAQRKVANNLQTKVMRETNKSEVTRMAIHRPGSAGWVKAPPPENLEGVEVRARKLHRASRLGGPRWKAPF